MQIVVHFMIKYGIIKDNNYGICVHFKRTVYVIITTWIYFSPPACIKFLQTLHVATTQCYFERYNKKGKFPILIEFSNQRGRVQLKMTSKWILFVHVHASVASITTTRAVYKSNSRIFRSIPNIFE